MSCSLFNLFIHLFNQYGNPFYELIQAISLKHEVDFTILKTYIDKLIQQGSSEYETKNIIARILKITNSHHEKINEEKTMIKLSLALGIKTIMIKLTQQGLRKKVFGLGQYEIALFVEEQNSSIYGFIGFSMDALDQLIISNYEQPSFGNGEYRYNEKKGLDQFINQSSNYKCLKCKTDLKNTESCEFCQTPICRRCSMNKSQFTCTKCWFFITQSRGSSSANSNRSIGAKTGNNIIQQGSYYKQAPDLPNKSNNPQNAFPPYKNEGENYGNNLPTPNEGKFQIPGYSPPKQNLPINQNYSNPEKIVPHSPALAALPVIPMNPNNGFPMPKPPLGPPGFNLNDQPLPNFQCRNCENFKNHECETKKKILEEVPSGKVQKVKSNLHCKCKDFQPGNLIGVHVSCKGIKYSAEDIKLPDFLLADKNPIAMISDRSSCGHQKKKSQDKQKPCLVCHYFSPAMEIDLSLQSLEDLLKKLDN
jgi:hypothetical protein